LLDVLIHVFGEYEGRNAGNKGWTYTGKGTSCKL